MVNLLYVSLHTVEEIHTGNVPISASLNIEVVDEQRGEGEYQHILDGRFLEVVSEL